MNKLKLGVIGISPGNGHPYSWSAIFNGYNEDKMKLCPYPVIYEYLSRQQFPNDAISEASVTHIWTQDRKISREIAEASKINFVVDNLEDMIGQVDAVLLARDDAENHLSLAMPFLNAGIPVYIDKPLSYRVEEAKKILALEKYEGQIFTCSGLRYAEELLLSDDQRNQIGAITKIIGTVPKDWKKYAIHLIDPLLANFKQPGDVVKCSQLIDNGATTLNFSWGNNVDICLTSTGASTGVIQLHFVGTNGEIKLTFKNTFKAFKNSLEAFIQSVKQKKRMIPIDQTLYAIKLIELGDV